MELTFSSRMKGELMGKWENSEVERLLHLALSTPSFKGFRQKLGDHFIEELRASKLGIVSI